MKHQVLITCPNLINTIEHFRATFAQYNIEITIPHFEQQLSEEELLRIIGQFDGVIAGDDPFTARVLEQGKRLKVLAKWGIGVDGIDLKAAERLGIPVINTPGVFSDEVADTAVGYIILLARQLHQIDRAVHNGEWLKPLGLSLRGKMLGIVGVGNIGKALGRRGDVMGMRLLGYDLYPISSEYLAEVGMEQVALQQLLMNADFIVLCCNLTRENYHLLDEQAFALMKHGVRIVNVARGPLIDEIALLKAIENQKVAGAALDVFEKEPLPWDSALRNYDNCIFGAHNSSNTFEAVMRVNEMAIQNLVKGLERVPA